MTSTESIRNDQLTGVGTALTLMTAILWGGNSVAIKMALAGVPPIYLAGLRFLLGGLFVIVWALISRTQVRLEAGELRKILRLILLFVTQIYFLNAGTYYTLAGRSTVLISAYPFFTTLFAHIYIKGDRASTSRFLGMALSFSAVIVVFTESFATNQMDYLLGDGLVLASACLLGARQIYTKRLAQDISPSKLLVWQSFLSLPIFFGASLLLEHDQPVNLTTAVTAGIFYQGIVIAGFCFLIMTSLLRKFQASRVGAFGFVTPIFGVILSSVLLDEPISIGLVGSVLLVGVGILIANRSE
jgi:drug/metabolite transporter (DMT)-like permease